LNTCLSQAAKASFEVVRTTARAGWTRPLVMDLIDYEPVIAGCFSNSGNAVLSASAMAATC
jgi:hypothetical protein